MKHSKKEQELIKKDEELIKLLLHNLYLRKGSGMSGGNFGDFAKSFLHGFTVPFKEFGNLFDLVAPGSGVVVNALANGIDQAVPGARYASMADVFNGKKIKGSGRSVGRPPKIKTEPEKPKRRVGRPSKQH